MRRSGKPILEPKVRFRTSGARDEPPMPSSKTCVCWSRRISSAKPRRSSAASRMTVGAVSQPRRLAMSSAFPGHRVAFLVHSRPAKSCRSSVSSAALTDGCRSAFGGSGTPARAGSVSGGFDGRGGSVGSAPRPLAALAGGGSFGLLAARAPAARPGGRETSACPWDAARAAARRRRGRSRPRGGWARRRRPCHRWPGGSAPRRRRPAGRWDAARALRRGDAGNGRRRRPRGRRDGRPRRRRGNRPGSRCDGGRGRTRGYGRGSRRSRPGCRGGRRGRCRRRRCARRRGRWR